MYLFYMFNKYEVYKYLYDLITALGGRYSGHLEGMQKPSDISSVIRLAGSRGTLETSLLAQELRASPAAPVLPATNGSLGLHIPCYRSLTLIKIVYWLCLWRRRKVQVLTMACKALGDLNLRALWPHLLLSPSFLLLHQTAAPQHSAFWLRAFVFTVPCFDYAFPIIFSTEFAPVLCSKGTHLSTWPPSMHRMLFCFSSCHSLPPTVIMLLFVCLLFLSLHEHR